MKNILVLRPFVSEKYIFVRNKNINTVTDLKEHIKFDDLKELEMVKNLNEQTFRNNLILTYKHHKILVDQKLKDIFPKDCNFCSQHLEINIMLDGFVGRE